jgi:glycosyltransferase involved in cell wall biosynthesis
MTARKWDILIASVVHRTEMLTDLLAELQRQMMPGVGVRVFRDNIDVEYGDKCQILLDSSSADYVSFLDDDDWIEPDFIKTILKALRKKPDYVGFNVKFTENGVPQMPVFHTLKYSGWVNNPEALYRDIVHFNPIRRELAVQSKWQGGAAADIHWADGLRNLGCVRDEVYIDREMYHYRHVGFSFQVPPRMDAPPLRPTFDFVTWIGEQ